MMNTFSKMFATVVSSKCCFFKFIFHDFDFFFLTYFLFLDNNLYAPDVFHDANQGVIPIILNALICLLSVNERKRIEAMCKEQLKSIFKNGVVGGIQGSKICGTGAEKFDFFINFSVLANSINKKSNLWNLYLLLRKILNFVLSDEVLKNDLDEFKSECRQFNTQFSKLFIGRTPFKVHHVDHYGDATENFGCLFHYSTVRYEREHQLMKKFVQSSLNYTSLPQQICYKWVVVNLIDLNESENDYSETKEDIYEIFEVPFIYNNEIPSYLMQFINTTENLITLNSTDLNGNEVNVGNVYLYKRFRDADNPLPEFVKIIEIFKQNNEIKVIGRLIFACSYHSDIMAFEVIEGQQDEIFVIRKVEWYKSINVIKTSTKYIILQNFYIPYEKQKKYERRIQFNENNLEKRSTICLTNNPSNYSDTESDYE